MLYIFDSTEQLLTTLPDGSFFNAVHREVLNGENTFQFSFPASEADAQYIVEGNLIGFRDLDAYWQVFEIKRIVDSHSDGLTRIAYCEHILYELLDDIVTDKRPSAGATAALAGMLEGTRWQVGIVDDLGAAGTNAYYESALSAIQKVANAWKGELNWRITVSNNQITARYVDLLAMRGTDTGKQFAYSEDIVSIEREAESSDVVTALYGRGKGIETGSGEGYGRRLTFADVVAPDKPAGQEWIGNDDALARWGRNGRHRFDVFVDEDETDPEVLLEKTRIELTRRTTPRVTYKLDVVSLEQISGYEHEQVRLGDLVRVIDREFRPELVVSARVIELERDLLSPENTKVVLGSFAPTIMETNINTQRRVSDLENKPYNTKWLDGVIDVLQNAIENRQAYIWETPQGTLHLNAPTYEEATEAMLLGGGRFAIANQKDGQGGWNWRTFGDGSGFTADLLNAGRVRADLVEIGAATTFAPGYDPTKITANSVGMGVDSDCIGLWHFDGSLNSHKGVSADSGADFDTGCFGQALDIATGKHLKVATTDMLASAGTVNLRIKNLSASANNAALIDLPKSDNTQGITCGISADTGHEGEIYISDSVKVSQSYTETTQADFNSGTLTNVVATSAGDLELNQIPVTNDDPTATMLSQSGISSFTASHCVDNDIATSGWHTDTATAGAYIKVDLGAGNAKAYVKVRVYVVNAGYAGNYSIQYSDDGINWNTCATNFTPSSAGWNEKTWGNAGKHRYWRLYLTNAPGSGSWLNEMEWYTDSYYKSSGIREKIVDLSGTNPVGGTEIEWSKTTPTNTTVKVETALSTDGGITYAAHQEATSGSSIPGIISSTDLSNARLKIKETLSTTDTTVTPQLNSLTFTIWEKQASTIYGPNKSTLTAWDSISLAWSSTRLSLVVNDFEAAYIENPGLPTAFGSYLYIGTDRNGANAINTLVDELRIDKVYREVATRTAWHKARTPFYTSEDMKQWPGYLKAESDGIKVYDSSNALRVLLGSWLESAVRKYGIKIIGGEIYASVIQSGEEGATSYIRLGDIWEPLEVVENGKRALNIWSSGGGMLQFYDTNLNDMAGQITPINDAGGQGLEIKARSTSGSINKDLILRGRFIRIHGYPPYSDQWSIYLDGHTFVTGNLTATGDIKGASKQAIQPTDDYGIRIFTAIEAPEHLYSDRGMCQLVNGVCTINLDPIFLECVEPDTEGTPWDISVNVRGKSNVFVTEVGTDYFKVEDDGGASNDKFTWRLEAVRKNYAGIRMPEEVI